MGLPVAYAIGTGPADVFGKSLVATIRHAPPSHVDATLGLLLATGAVPGVEIGKRLVLRLERLGPAGSTVGAQLGATATCHLPEKRIRLYFGALALLTAVSVALKELSMRLSAPQINTSAAWLLIGDSGLVASLIL